MNGSDLLQGRVDIVDAIQLPRDPQDPVDWTDKQVTKLQSRSDGNLYVTSRLTDEVLRYDGTTGDFLDVFVNAGSGGMQNIVDAVFGPDGNLYVTDRDINSVLRFDGSTGSFLDLFVSSDAGGLDFPHELIFGPDDNL